MIIAANPSFVNIGADRKGCGLKEPSKEELLEFIARLQDAGVTIKKKTNLERILRGN